MVQPVRARIEESDLTRLDVGGVELHLSRNIRSRGKASTVRLPLIRPARIVSFIIRRDSSLGESTPFVNGSNNYGFIRVDAIEESEKRKFKQITGEPGIEMSR